MTEILAPERIEAAPTEAVDPLLRSTRAAIARLSLELRTASHHADRLDAEGTFDPAAVEEMLRRGLEESIEVRRRAMDEELTTARALFDVELARARAEAESSDVGVPADIAIPSDDRADVLASAGDGEHRRPEVDAGERLAAPVATASPTPEAATGATAEHLTAMVAAAVVAGMSQFRPEPASVSPVARTEQTRPSLRSRLLHLDVLLPLIAIVIVLVVLIAWIG